MTGVYAHGAKLPNDQFVVSSSEREIRFVSAGAVPDEIFANIEIDQSLTTRRNAGLSSGVLAILSALIAAVTQYFVAVKPAEIQALTERENRTAELAKCKSRAEQNGPAPSPMPVVTAADNGGDAVNATQSTVTITRGQQHGK